MPTADELDWLGPVDYLAVELPPHVHFGPWPELVCRQLLGAHAQGLGQVRAIDPDVAVLRVDAAHDQ